MRSTVPIPSSAHLARRNEIARQYEILAPETRVRVALTLFGFTLCATYLHPLVVIGLASLLVIAELANVRLMAGLDPAQSPRTYQTTLLSVVVMEGSFTLAAGLVWQVDDPFAKAFAVGMVMVTLLQLTTVRAIHLPYGLIGIATVATVVFCANTFYWVPVEGWSGLAISTAAALGGIGYAVVAMLSNHDLHRRTAEGQARARAADDAKTRFLAQLSHELRTPLNAIIGLGQIERETAISPQSRDRLSTLVDSARGLAVVLDDVLDLSSIGAGRFILRPKGVDIRSELAMVVATFQHQASNQNLQLSLTCDTALPSHLVLDPQRMRQCLINLISNALKHVSNGQISLVARLTRPERPLLEIDVADTGPGIPAELHEQVFEPFTTGGTGAAGSGLGLSIGRSLAREMGGNLVLLPSKSGAVFRLTLQVEPMDAPPSQTEVAAPRLVGSTVLVVDDIATNRMVAASFLAATGTRVIEAVGGEDAIDKIAAGRIDLVFLDMNMPGMDGFETFRRIRAMGGWAARIPVVAMTADVLAERRAQITAAGLDGFVAKPLSTDELHAVLTTHLGPAPAPLAPTTDKQAATPGNDPATNTTEPRRFQA